MIQQQDQDYEYSQKGEPYSQSYQKQGNQYIQQQQISLQQQQQQQKINKQNASQNERIQQNSIEDINQFKQKAQLQLQVPNQQFQFQAQAIDEQQNQKSDDEENFKLGHQLIYQYKKQLQAFLDQISNTANEEQYKQIIDLSLKLSFEFQCLGNIQYRKQKYKEAENFFFEGLRYTYPVKIMEEPINGPNGEKLSRKENNIIEWYLQRISIANSLYVVFKKRKKVGKIIETIKLVLSECESCCHKTKLQEHPQSNIENLYYYLAEYTHMFSSSQINQKNSQLFVNGQISLTNIAQIQQNSLLQQKQDIEETMKYAKQCMNIIITKYKNVQNKKFGDKFIIDKLSLSYLEKKQIMLIHIIHLIGRALQQGEFFVESLSFYKQAYFLARSYMKKRGIDPGDGNQKLLNSYKDRINQVVKIIQNDIDENMASEQLDKIFKEDLEIAEIGSDDPSKQQKTLSLNFDAIQSYLQTSEVNEIFEGFAPTHAKQKQQQPDDDNEENQNLFSDETLVESQILFFTDFFQKTQHTDKSKKSSNKLTTKEDQKQNLGQKNQQLQGAKTQKINRKEQDNKNQKTRNPSFNIPTKESLIQERIKSAQMPNIQNNAFQFNNNQKQNFASRQLSRQRSSKIFGQIDQENEVTLRILEQRSLKRFQGTKNIDSLVNKLQANYNNFLEHKKELSQFLPQSSYFESVQDQQLFSRNNEKNQLFNGQQPETQNLEDYDKMNNQFNDFKSNQNSLSIQDQYFKSPKNLNFNFLNKQQSMQNSFQAATIKKHKRPLTSNTQLSTYRPQSSTKNLLLKLNQEDYNLVDNLDYGNTSGQSSNKNINIPKTNTPKSPSYLVNSLYKYELLVRPQESKQNSSTQKKGFQIKKSQYQIKINTNNDQINTNNSYYTIDEQGDENQKLANKHPLKHPQIRVNSLHVQNPQIKIIPQNQIQRQRPQTSLTKLQQVQSRSNQKNTSEQISSSQIIYSPDTLTGQKKPSIQIQFSKQQQQQQVTSSNEQKYTEDQQKQQSPPLKHKNSFEIFDDDGTYNFIQGFDFEKVISQKFERLMAEEAERNQKDKENSLQKLEFVGPDNKNMTQNQPSLQNDDDLFSDEGDREGGIQEDKQQQENQNNNNKDNQNNNLLLDPQNEKALNEQEKLTREKEELFLFKQFKFRETKRIQEINSLFQKVKQCKDRYLAFYSRFNNSEVCIWKLEKFKIKFKVIESNKNGFTSQQNFSLKNNESLYKLTLTMDIESMYYTGKLVFTIQNNEIEFLENFLFETNIVTRWGIADFILNYYFNLPKNSNLQKNWKQFYQSLDEGYQQIIISFDNTIGRYQGEFQQQENSELINIGLKLSFLISQSLLLIKTPTGNKLRFISQQENSSSRNTLNYIPQIEQTHLHQQNELNQEENNDYQKNYYYLKEFLKIRRQIVRKTIINLETLSPQIFIRFGVQKKIKQNFSPKPSPNNSADQLIDLQEYSKMLQYQRMYDYVEEYKKYLSDNLAVFERNLFMNEDIVNKGLQLQTSHMQKQLEMFSQQRSRQKSSIPNLNALKPQQSTRGQLGFQPSNTNFNTMLNSYNMVLSLNPHINAQRLSSQQQQSPHSNNSIEKVQRYQQSRNNSIAQLPEIYPAKYSGELEYQEDIHSPSDNLNISIDSQQSIIRNIQAPPSGSNSNSHERQNMSRQESFKKAEKENSRIEYKSSQEEDQQTNQMLQMNQAQNPTIERFFQRNLNKKSTFSMIKRNEQNDKDVSDNKSQSEAKPQEEILDDSVELQRNVSLQINNYKENDDTPSGRQKSQLNEFASNYNKDSEYIDKLSSSQEITSFEDKYRRLTHTKPSDIIELFKQDMNLSISSKSSIVDSLDEEKQFNDQEELSSIPMIKQKVTRRRNLNSKNSQDLTQSLTIMYTNQMAGLDQKNQGSIDQRLFSKQNLNDYEKMIQSDIYPEEAGTAEINQSKMMAQIQQLQQQQQQNQETSLERAQKDMSKNRSDDQKELEEDDLKNFSQDGYILPFQGEQASRIREDSKNLQHTSENTNSTQNEQVQSQVATKIPISQQTNGIEELIKQKVDQFRNILQRQLKIRFCNPQKYIEYFEENKNIAQIAIPNIFINAFRQKDVLLCGIMRLNSMSMEEYNRRKEGIVENGQISTQKLIQHIEDNEENSFNFNKFQNQNTKIIQDQSEKDNFFVTIQISYTVNAKDEWDVEKLKNDVQIHVEAVQIQTNFAYHPTQRYSSQFSFYEFIETLFAEDNDLQIQEYYDTIQRLLKNISQDKNDDFSSNNENQNQFQEDSILNEENYGLNMETLQYEGLNPYTDFNIKFQKAVCKHLFKLNKFIYNIGFNKLQKKILLERLNSQMITVEKQLKLIPRKIKKYRILNEKLYFVDEQSYQLLVQKELEQKILFQQQVAAQFKKLTLNSPTNINISSIQQFNTKLTFYQTQLKKKITKNENEEQNQDENQEKQNEVNEQEKKKNNEVNELKAQISNAKLSPNNSIDFDENELQKRNQYFIEIIQDIILSEKIFHLFQILSREHPVQLEYQQVLTKQQFEEKQQLLIQQQQIQLQQQQNQQALQQQQQQDQENYDNSRSQIRISSFDTNFRRESLLEKSQNMKSPVNKLTSSVSQEVGLQSKKSRKPSISTQKVAYQFKKQIRGDPRNKVFEIYNEERERNYKDGRINHPYAMTYYNSILRIVNKDKNNYSQNQTQKKHYEERNSSEQRESFRREEDFRIIDIYFSNKDGFRKKIKVDYLLDIQGDLIANISFYDPLSYRVETVRVKEKKNLEKLQNLLQVDNYLLRNQRLREILIKMNLKWNKKIIGRKLEFRSFIETNEEFFNYKLNRKMNPNDEALYKLMTTRNYLDENKEQFTNFLYKVKLALISNDQNAETAEQNYFFNTYFYSTRVQQFQNITNLGRALIQTTVYQSKLLYTSDNYIFIRIDIAPAAKRTKLIKMILDYNDIITIFSKTKYNQKNCLDPESITKMIMEFATKVNYSHTQNYNALKIPFWKQFNQISESSDYDLVNQFDFNSMNTKQEISFLSKKSMLTPVLRTHKIIYQGIKKIKGEFLVITVKRYIYLNIDWFQLIIYIPKTCRRFICFLMEQDMLKFDSDFMESVIPLVIVKFENNINELKQYKNYFQFCKAFDQMHKKLLIQEMNENTRKNDKKITYKSENWFKNSSQVIKSQSHLHSKNKLSQFQISRTDFHIYDKNITNQSLQSIESIKDLNEQSINSSQLRFYMNQAHVSKYSTQKINFVKYFQKNLTEQTSYLEKKVWEHLISAIVIEENQQHKLVLKINTFNGILRETLSSIVINMNERDNILYEFYIEEYKRKTLNSIFSKSTPLMLNDSFTQNLYIRLHFFGQDIVHNQKVCGRHMLYSFHKQSRSKLKNTNINREQLNNQSQQKINLSQTQIGSGDSNPKIPSLSKISNNQQQTSKQTLKQRTSILDKKGGSVQIMLNSQKKNFEKKRTSFAAIQKMKQEQIAAEDNPFLYSFKLNNMQDMAIFYANKIKANYNKFVKEREKKQLKGKIQDYLSLYKSKSLEKDVYCKAILKANNNFKRSKEIDPQQIKYFIIYRRILTVSPRQMVTIFYKPNKETFYIYCWNNINSKDIILKKKLKEVEKYIPHCTYFLKSKLYKDLGDRIFLCFKNQLLLQTYNHLKIDLD
ncbi:hypothetical protein TTHERM_00522130 (macronuclear) [Tetrahymena thermophila SB210]|uniref:Uncharacterized protein n=1 Tax=Tetrahymena thermophila (strain SB210) TaxID=312017 RepID=I7ME30_TETTS|nr:hypothetical protein TTHERM_00522130 [Tetrahymena thermophila SB210]EAR94146.2 hypothetical protein TTHERM_00522130 [Tetrahymena thermophila SB210]|eukprot:XP_001014391.2 hypothetical protein TTHERM_00522130 [Tetrahymena thermophila SB210]